MSAESPEPVAADPPGSDAVAAKSRVGSQSGPAPVQSSATEGSGQASEQDVAATGQGSPADRFAGDSVPVAATPLAAVLVHRSGAAYAADLTTTLAANNVVVVAADFRDPSEAPTNDTATATAAILCADDAGFPPDADLVGIAARADADLDFAVVIVQVEGDTTAQDHESRSKSAGPDTDGSLPESIAASHSIDLTGERTLAAPTVGERIRTSIEREGTPRLSKTIRAAVDELGQTKPVTAAELANAILVTKRSRTGSGRPYANGLDPGTLVPGRTPRRSVTSWLRQVDGRLARPTRQRLNGRRVVVTLADIEPQLKARLQKNGYLEALRAEADPGVEERVPTYTDNPADSDTLGRQSFAKVVARRIRWMRIREAQQAGGRRGGAFMLHVYGPWGVGKTSLLRLLRTELYLPDPDLAGKDKRVAGRWAVIEFNAWQHQRIAPPWWWLMSAVYRQGLRELRSAKRYRRAARLMAREWMWRLRGGWMGFATIIAVVGAVIVLDLIGALTNLRTGSWTGDPKALITATATVVTAVGIIWGTLSAVSRWVFATSARGARAFIDHTRDPMQTVQAHMVDLTDWIGLPVLVYIDDLDRCQAKYVVELLEGIQTLFREAPIAYVVTADREWLTCSFAKEYADFAQAVDEPGRTLGEFFLEKTFQLAAPVPELDPAITESYWLGLISDPEAKGVEDLNQLREDARATFEQTRSQEDVASTLARQTPDSAAELRVLFEQAAVRLSTPELERQSEHVLRVFHPLIGANPRAIKRLINAYGLLRATRTATGRIDSSRVAQEQAALWSILAMRWPRLADYLHDHPGRVTLIGKPATDKVAKKELEALKGELDSLNLRSLFDDPQVIKVINGSATDVHAKLDEEAIRSLSTA